MNLDQNEQSNQNHKQNNQALKNLPDLTQQNIKFEAKKSKRLILMEKRIQKFQESMARCEKHIINLQIQEAMGVLGELMRENTCLDLLKFSGFCHVQNWRGYYFGGPLELFQAVRKKQQFQGNPFDLLLLFYSIQIYQKTIKAEQVINQYIILEQFFPQRYQVALSLGSIYYYNGQYLQAEKKYQCALEMTVNCQKGEEYLSWVRGVIFQRRDLAVEHCKKSLEINPHNVYSQFLQSCFTKDKSESIPLYQNILKAHPKYVRATFELVCFQQNYEIRLQKLKNIIQEYPRYEEARLQYALTLMKLKKYQEARLFYHRQIQLYGQNGQIFWGLGRISQLQQQMNFDEAIKCYKKAIELSPYAFKYYYILARCYDFQGQINHAVNLMEKCIKLNPYSSKEHFFLGQLFEKKSNLGMAIIHYRNCAKIDLSNIKAFEKMLSIIRKKGNYNQEIKVLKDMLSRDDKNSNIMLDLAKAELNLQHVNQASDWAAKCIENGADRHNDVYLFMGDLEYEKENFRKSFQWYLTYTAKQKKLRTIYLMQNFFNKMENQVAIVIATVNIEDEDFFRRQNVYKLVQIGQILQEFEGYELVAFKCYEYVRLQHMRQYIDDKINRILNEFYGVNSDTLQQNALGIYFKASKYKLLTYKEKYFQKFKQLLMDQ